MSVSTTTITNRLELVAVDATQPGASFAQDVRTGLTAQPKWLPSKYFYDEAGSALFDAITLLPEYYLTRAETEILTECGWEIVRALGGPVEFVELGSGSAVKTRILIEEALRAHGALRYSPIDISPEALRASALSLVAEYPALSVTAYAGDYFGILETPLLRRAGRVLAMFMGSNIGNYAPGEAGRLMRALAGSLKPGDGLLLGVDLKKDAAILEAAYDDPAGVTAAFNKNLLVRINGELGGAFDVRAFSHVAHYEPSHSRVASYLQAERAAAVPIDSLELSVVFEQGERIHTESSYKFSHDDIAALGDASGFSLARTWTDKAQRFGVHLLVRRP